MGKKSNFTKELEQGYYRWTKKKSGVSPIDILFMKIYDGDTTALVTLLKKLIADKVKGEGFDTNINNINYSLKVEVDGKTTELPLTRQTVRSLEK